MKRFALSGALACALATAAHATIIANLDSVTPSGSNFDFNYSATLAPDERLDPAQTAVAPCPGSSSPCNPSGTFFTIYDIPGFVGVIAVPTNWVDSTQLTGVTPSLQNGFTDDPALMNVTFSYTGPVAHGDTLTSPFTGFVIESTDGGMNTNGVFTSQATKDAGLSAGNTDQAIGPVTVPAADPTVPEPPTTLLTGFGLILAGLPGVKAFQRYRR